MKKERPSTTTSTRPVARGKGEANFRPSSQELTRQGVPKGLKLAIWMWQSKARCGCLPSLHPLRW